MKSYRFGVKLGWPFANAGIVVIKLDDERAAAIEQGLTIVRLALSASGNNDIASKIVFEERK